MSYPKKSQRAWSPTTTDKKGVRDRREQLRNLIFARIKASLELDRKLTPDETETIYQAIDYFLSNERMSDAALQSLTAHVRTLLKIGFKKRSPSSVISGQTGINASKLASRSRKSGSVISHVAASQLGLQGPKAADAEIDWAKIALA